MPFKFPSVVSAHRGCGSLAPENTLEAIQCGTVRYNFKSVEFDVMLTKDNIPILMHDEHIGRTIRMPTISSELMISDLTWCDLKDIDAGSWFHSNSNAITNAFGESVDHGLRYESIKIPLFDDILQYCYDHSISMNVEIKPCPGYEVQTSTVIGQYVNNFYQKLKKIDDSFDDKLILFSSFSYDSLIAIKDVCPSIPRGLLIEGKLPEDYKILLENIEAVSLHVDHSLLDECTTKTVKESGYCLFCYTVNTLDRAKELLSWGVDSFCTDRVDIINDTTII